jgi:hypothetical protein
MGFPFVWRWKQDDARAAPYGSRPAGRRRLLSFAGQPPAVIEKAARQAGAEGKIDDLGHALNLTEAYAAGWRAVTRFRGILCRFNAGKRGACAVFARECV